MTRRVDRLLFLNVLMIGLVGLIALYSASAVMSDIDMKDPFYYANRQIVWTVVGLTAFLVIIFLPVSFIERLTVPGMMLAILGLLLVFVPGAGKSVSSTRESFHRWVEIGPVSFQPSEFAKIALILYSAWVLHRYQSGGDLRRLLIRGTPVPLALLLIILEPQYGTTVTLIAVLACLVFITGFPVMRLLGVLVASLPLLFMLAYLWEYRLERLKVWLDPYAYRYEAGYQLVMSFRAFRDGWWTGTDLASGVAHRYLTFGHTDFVLALFYEDFGYIGLVGLVLLYGFFCFRAIRLIAKQPEDFASLSAAGCVILFGLQSLINMFVVTGVVPTTGISLPFMSYGGSSLVVQYILAGLVLNFTSQNRQRAVLPLSGERA
ncbi:MAG: cell division protein FtsW [Leptonema illini]|uniref:Probable peptidoglycan glycosyltransferase FtsW n=1 Tax=Leptonema illini TaxID=183 RepID=A0A833H0R9_9LEPT|nr:MAG: cell division protein FtsW [Leptonema illini]